MAKWLTPVVISLLALGLFAGFAKQEPPALADRRAAGSVSAQDGRLRYDARASPVIALPGGHRAIIHSLLNVPERMHYGEYVWNEAGAPPGAVWIRVDLDSQLVSVFRSGHEIGSAVILYGDPTKPTPSGAFTVLEKAQDHYSRSYDAPMPYMLRLTRDGVAIHASAVQRGAATHGCIGVPMAFARKLFAVVHTGDPVFVVGGKGFSQTLIRG